MLSKRQNDILKNIVEEYIKTAKPVSSSGICERLNCSSATVRNEMVELEELGYLEKNHFASGRSPSETGYKYYVENLMTPKTMTGEDMLKLQTIFHNNSLDISDTIKKSIEIISEITNYTTVVLDNNSKDNRLKKVETVPLDRNKVLTIVITDKGYVEHKTLTLPDTIEVDEVRKTVELINKLLIGTPINEVSEKLEYEIKPIIGKYVKQHEVLYNAFHDKVKELLTKFDDVSNITEEKENGINIYIGHDNEFSSDVSIIKTKYNYNGEEGTIAIIGPKRMEYDRVVSLLDYLKNNLDNK